MRRLSTAAAKCCTRELSECELNYCRAKLIEKAQANLLDMLLRLRLLLRLGQLCYGAIHQLDATTLRSIVLHFAVEDLKGFGRLQLQLRVDSVHICHAIGSVDCAGIRLGICVMGRRHELNFPGQINRFVIWFTSYAAYLYRERGRERRGARADKAK